MFQTDLSDRTWLAARKRHVLDVVFGYLCLPGLAAKKPTNRQTRLPMGVEP
jgi:hypothetical protein